MAADGSRTGTWQSGPGEVKAAVSYALKAGYKCIDAAYCYGNEDEVGEGLKEAFASGVKREDIFIITKLWCTYQTRVELALDKSLKSLGLDYVDLFLVVCPGPRLLPCSGQGALLMELCQHWPVAMNPEGKATDMHPLSCWHGSRLTLYV